MLDGRLVQVSDPGQLDSTLDELEAAASSTDDAGQAKAQAARRRLIDCDTGLARYRTTLEAGTDPVVVSAWIAEVQAERLSAEVELEQATGQRSCRVTRDQLAALVTASGTCSACSPTPRQRPSARSTASSVSRSPTTRHAGW